MSSYFDSVKRFLRKENFNFDRTDVSIYNFHPQLFIFLGLNGIFFNKNFSVLRFVGPFFAVGLGTVALVLEMMFIIHYITINDYSLGIECVCYFMVLSAIPTVNISIAFNTSKLQRLLEKMNDDFNTICKQRNRKSFLNGQLMIWKMCAAWFSFVLLLCVVFTLLPLTSLTYNTLFVTQDENTVRPLLFPVWLPHDDPYRTPNYELFLVVEIMCVLCFAQTFGVYVYILFHILLHCYTIMDMITLDFNVLFDGLEENVVFLPKHHTRRVEVQHKLNMRIGCIVKMHLSVFEAIKTVSSVYGFPLMYQMTISCPVICLTAYEIVEKLENGRIDIFFILLGVAGVLQLWISCYLGTVITNKAVTIKFVGLPCVGLKTFSLASTLCTIVVDFLSSMSEIQHPPTVADLEIMTRAYTYFNMLRQYT